MNTSKIKFIRKINKKDRYDLTVQGNHNFFANGILIHNCNGRFVYDGEKFHCGSHYNWKKESDINVWWKALYASPWLQEFLKANPDIAVYGEVYGSVQDLKYGTRAGEVRLVVFDLLKGSEWLPHEEAREIGETLTWAPIVYEGEYNAGKLKTLADGPSLIPGANHMREGIVIKPLVERTDYKLGRVQLKIVSSDYLERAK